MVMASWLLLIVSVALGAWEGRRRATCGVVIVTSLVLMAVSIGLLAWPHFDPDDPGSWWLLYGTGLVYSGPGFLVVYAGPFIIAYVITARRVRKRDESVDPPT